MITTLRQRSSLRNVVDTRLINNIIKLSLQIMKDAGMSFGSATKRQ